MDYIELINKAKQLRKDVLYMTTKAGIGHVTSSFSVTEIMVALFYGNILKFDASKPTWDKRDYMILSKAHANPIFYCILADLGYFPKSYLNDFAQPGGKIGVLLRGDIPGAEYTSGSVGCGLGIAAGIATSLKIDNKNNKVYCIVGDAELREGAIWESLFYISSSNLNNLITIIDKNKLGATHFTEEEAQLEPLDLKFEAFGFKVIKINGHDYNEIFKSLNITNIENKPLLIIADTIKGKGVSFIESKPLKHGEAVKKEDLDRAIKEIEEGLR